MERTSPWATGAALAVTFAVIYVACAVAVALYPDRALEFFNAWFHGLDLRLVRRPPTTPITVGEWVFGFATAVVASFLAGALYGWARNLFGRR
jgi:hypothetical protein